MVRTNLIALVLATVVVGFGAPTSGQDESDSRPKRFFDDLDNLGRNLLGRPTASPTTRKNTQRANLPTGVTAPRAGSIAGPQPSVPAIGHTSPVYAGTSGPTREPSVMVPHTAPAAPAVSAIESPPPAPAETPASSLLNRPLHERMSNFRRSTFAADPKPAAAAPPSAVAEPTAVAKRPTAEHPAVAPPEQPAVAPPEEPAETPAPTSPPPAAETVDTTAARPEPVQPEPTRARPSETAAPRDDLLIARKSPVLSVETLGPRRISVGKESVYQLNLANAGEVAADDVVVHIDLPAWADVVGVEASLGAAQVGATSDVIRPMAWRVGSMPAGARQKLMLRLVPRESRAFDLAVRWDCLPAASQAMIEVQEPKLAMHLEGPREVLYGRKELYALKLSNTGTGDAENVLITLMPVGGGDNKPVAHRLGAIPAGQERLIEVELTARQTGDLMIQVEAHGDHGVRAELGERVLVRRAALQMDVEGPQVQFVNAVAAYRVRVSNPGNAAARNIRVTVTLPSGAKYVSGVETATAEADGTRVQWSIDSVPANAEQVFVLRCSLGTAGPARLEAACQADDALTAAAGATTRVDAMADLRLEIKDPSGPVAVGEEAIYELKVRNRGTKAAEAVEVLAFFSEGIEPVAVEGAAHKMQPGQVVFNPIPAIAPGAEVAMRVRAKALAAGSHVFRAEVHCKPLGTRLVSEETTHFYQDALGAAPQMAVEPDAAPAGPRTAERYTPPASAPVGGLMPSPLKR